MSSVADLFASIVAQHVRVAAVFLPFPFPFARS